MISRESNRTIDTEPRSILHWTSTNKNETRYRRRVFDGSYTKINKVPRRSRVGTAVRYRTDRFEQCIECFNIKRTAFLTFHRRCNNRKINSLRLLRALINVLHGAASRLFFHLGVIL